MSKPKRPEVIALAAKVARLVTLSVRRPARYAKTVATPLGRGRYRVNLYSFAPAAGELGLVEALVLLPGSSYYVASEDGEVYEDLTIREDDR